MKEALLYEKLDKRQVHCFLCSHHCRISDGKFGICGVRKNEAGTLYSMVYGRVIAANVDPIEKKPLYHFLPGSTSFSIATIGCNFRCGFCQNWEISQSTIRDGFDDHGMKYSPQEVVAAALRHGCKSISYTYTEPTIFFEYALDCAKLAKEKGLANVFVTNGFMTGEALKMIRPYLDAANVDLKYFRDDSYRTVCGGSLEPVKDSIRLMHELGIWVEVTTLVVPGSNDSPEELGGIARFIAGVDQDIPWHLSRFYPNYKFNDTEPTEEKVLKDARQAGFDAGLRYVYVGNVFGWGNDTVCFFCKKTLIQRRGFTLDGFHCPGGICEFCRKRIAGVFS